MSEKFQTDLLIDLAKLLKKYGPNSFEDLANYLSSPEGATTLADVLSTLAKNSKKVYTATATAKQNPPMPQLLIKLKVSDPKKYEMIMPFYTKVVNRELLSTLREIKNFAREFNLEEIRGDSRQKAILQLLVELSNCDKETLNKILATSESSSNRSLEGWGNIILNRKQTE